MKNQKPKRDYRAEYARRVARGMEKGLSRSQARGHPKAREKNVRKVRLIADAQLQISLQELRKGKTLSEAAAAIHVSAERLRNQAVAQRAIQRRRGRWVVRTDVTRRMQVYSRGKSFSVMLNKKRHASLLGKYMSAVGKFISTNDPAPLKPFIGKSITDANGTEYPFETNLNTLYRLAASSTESFEQVYRIVPQS